MGTELVLMALLNSLVDLLLLAGTNRLAGCPCRWGRLWPGQSWVVCMVVCVW